MRLIRMLPVLMYVAPVHAHGLGEALKVGAEIWFFSSLGALGLGLSIYLHDLTNGKHRVWSIGILAAGTVHFVAFWPFVYYFLTGGDWAAIILYPIVVISSFVFAVWRRLKQRKELEGSQEGRAGSE